jgi:hypothetical protein
MIRYVKISCAGSDTYYVYRNAFEECFKNDVWAFLSNPASKREQVSAYIKKTSGKLYMLNAQGDLVPAEPGMEQMIEECTAIAK